MKNILDFKEKTKKRNYKDVYIKTTKEDVEYLPELTETNIKILLDSMDIKVKYNEVTKECISDTSLLKNENDDENYEDIILSMVEDELMRDNFKSRSINTLMRKLDTIAFRDSFNPIKDYLIKNYNENKKNINTEYKEFNKLFDSLIIPCKYKNMQKTLVERWLISCVASQLERNFESHGVLTFSGPQGIGKTTFFKTLIPNSIKPGSPSGNGYFKESFYLDTTNKDHQIQYIRNWIVELGEIGSMLKKDIDLLKAFLTSGSDSIRNPFGKKQKTTPRRTVAGATVNGTEFLKDDENRRFWVIELTDINLDELKSIDINLLWAEIFDMYSNGRRWYLLGDEIKELNNTNVEYRQKTETESYLSACFDWDSEERYYLTVSDIYTIVSRRLRNITSTKIGKALARMNITYVEKRARKKYYEVPRLLKEYDIWSSEEWEKKFETVSIKNYEQVEREAIKNEK